MNHKKIRCRERGSEQTFHKRNSESVCVCVCAVRTRTHLCDLKA